FISFILILHIYPIVRKPFLYLSVRQSLCFSCVYSNPPEFLFGQISIHSLKGNCYEEITVWHFCLISTCGDICLCTSVQGRGSSRVGSDVCVCGEFYRGQHQHRKFSRGCRAGGNRWR